MRRGTVALLLLLALVALPACSSDEDAAEGSAGSSDGSLPATTDDGSPAGAAGTAQVPGESWDTVEPTAAGFDPAALDELAAQAEAAGSGCLVVTRDGELVLDETWGPGGPGQPREAFSVTKSFTSVLTGIAQDQELLSLDQPAADLILEWRDTPAEAVTVEDLLANDSGREWSLQLDYRQMAVQAPDKTQFAIDLDQPEAPGEVWAYNNSAIQTLSEVLAQATGEQAQAFAERELFEPIGMADSSMRTDAAGGTLTFMGLQTTCQDLARFGTLMLHDGRWGDQQVVSADYVEQATGGAANELVDNYGLLFWLNRPGRLAEPTIAVAGPAGAGEALDGQMVPSAPEDVFWALGFNSQVVTMIPSEGVVAVRMGAAPPADQPFGYAELTTGVLDALG